MQQTLLILCAGLLLLGVGGRAVEPIAATGASIHGRAADLTLYVAPKGNDGADGSEDKPLKTVGKAVELAAKASDAGKQVGILIEDGTYRERVVLPKGVANPGKLYLMGDYDSAFLSGADLWQDGWTRFHVEWEEWKWYGGDHRFDSARIYKHDWPYNWEDCENPWGGAEILLDPVVKRPEMLCMNGKPLRLVLNFGDLREGTFYVNRDVKKVYLWPPAGLEPQTAQTEVSVRTNVLDTGGRANVMLLNLSFKQARPATYGAGLLINGSTNVLVQECHFTGNGWSGVGCCFAHDITIRDCYASYNGISGMGAYQTTNLLIDGGYDNYNNWRGKQGGFVNWASGSKYMSTRRLTIHGLTAEQNDTYGLWLDSDNKDVRIESVILTDNLLGGIFLEANQGPILLRKCRISGNRVGVMDGRSDNVTLLDNDISNNREAQIQVTGDPNGRDITEFDTNKALHTRSLNWRVEGNRISTNSAAPLYQVAGHIPATEWAAILKTMTAAHNTYTAPSAASFKVRDTTMTLAEWQQRYGIDQDSTFVRTTKAK